MDTQHIERSDRIEYGIDVAATAERVFELVSEPGWFINDGAIVEHRVERREDDLQVVHDPTHGAFALRTVALERPSYAAFRWLDDPDDPDSASTLVEFTIEPRAEGVRLTVVESGFAGLPGSAADHRRSIEENTEGWRLELRLARDLLEGSGGQRRG